MRLVTAAQMRELDRRAAEEFGIPSLLLMENAGRAVAEHALDMLAAGSSGVGCRGSGVAGGRIRPPTPDTRHPTPRVAVYCGHGNNGGDGFVAARHLANAGCEVRLFLAAGGREPQGDAAVNLEIVRRMALPLRLLENPPSRPWEADLVVDAVLGTGIRGEVTGGPAALIAAINRSSAPVLAVDLPSGLDSDTGRLAGASVAAACTVTLALPKLGLALYPGRSSAGRIEVADISLPRALLEGPDLASFWLLREHIAGLLPSRPPTAHKGDNGRILVLAGSAGMAGAAALAADAAVRGGGGLVTLGCPVSLLDVLAAKVTEVMTLPLPETDARSLDVDALPALRDRLEALDVVAVGPGLGRHPRTGEFVRALLRAWRKPIVIDADALNLASPAGHGVFPPQAVLTPHPGELARLLDSSTAAVEADRVAAARQAAERFRCVTLLKGAATLVAAPDGRLGVNATGTPAMATGGCGDVLTGLLAALLGQRLPPFEAACAAAHLHGLAGELAEARIGGPGLAAGDLLHLLPRARAAVAASRPGVQAFRRLGVWAFGPDRPDPEAPNA